MCNDGCGGDRQRFCVANDGSAAGAPLSKTMISIKITAEIHEGKDTLDRDCRGMSVLVQLSAEKQLHAVMVKLKKSMASSNMKTESATC